MRWAGAGNSGWFDSANATSVATAEGAVLARTAARRRVLLQETKTLGDEATAAITRRLRRHGWNSTVAPAWRTGADRASGGVAVCARRAYGLTPHDCVVPEACAHRTVSPLLGWAAFAEAVCTL
jgi:hypothetical protein